MLSHRHIANRIFTHVREKEHETKFGPQKNTTLYVFHLSSALKTSGIMIRPHVSAQNTLFHDICNFLFFLMLHFEHTVIIWNNRW